MSCRQLGCENKVTVSQNESVFTFTVGDCRFTSPEIIRTILTQFACEYFKTNNAIPYLMTQACCERLPLDINIASGEGTIELDFSNWILADGTWNDSGVWIDLAIWE